MFLEINRLFLAQLVSILITILVAIVGSLICIGIVRIFTPLRTDAKRELIGMDQTQHGESYILPLMVWTKERREKHYAHQN